MVDRDELKDTEYDGIQEYDNDLPRWWVQLFWITIIGGIGYAIWFHLPSTPTPEERLATQMAQLAELRGKNSPPPSADPQQESKNLLVVASNPDALKKGAEIFATKCLPCHGPLGQGLVGPNLTDDFWIHGGSITDIKKVIVDGVIEKGMLSWKSMLTNEEIDAVVGFVWSLHGTNPAGAKAAEGTEFKRE